jgi:hypothetical protein
MKIQLPQLLILLLLIVFGSACGGSEVLRRLTDQGSSPEGMHAFEGQVFVASTLPVSSRWNQAGWKVSSQSVAGDRTEIPDDCTLYPHQGVDHQWIGNCAGRILIPCDGADHIAVMHTRSDGSTEFIQVAPPPLASAP